MFEQLRTDADEKYNLLTKQKIKKEEGRNKYKEPADVGEKS